jgi:hypothetical protein
MIHVQRTNRRLAKEAIADLSTVAHAMAMPT